AQRAPEEIAALPGVSQVIGNSHKHQVAELALCLPPIGQGFVGHGFVSGHVVGRADRAGLEGAASAAEGSSVFVPLHALTDAGRPKTNDGANDRQPTTNDHIHVSDIFAHTELLAAPGFDAANERTRPNLKVQDGCDNRCSFCVIPYVRGQSRSLRLESVVREVQQLVAAGYREVVISGINLGRWGRDLAAVDPQYSGVKMENPSLVSGHAFGRADYGLQGAALAAEVSGFGVAVNDEPRPTNDALPTTDDRRLTTLIRAILDQANPENIRISSPERLHWTDELTALVDTEPRIAKHAHVPLQSGSDRILRAMHRKYRPWHYREKILKIRAAMPTAAIGADVMVGFPGETDLDFEETRHMIEE